MKDKLPTYKQLAIYLGVSESAIKQYNPKKRELMIVGLYEKNKEKAYNNEHKDSMGGRPETTEAE